MQLSLILNDTSCSWYPSYCAVYMYQKLWVLLRNIAQAEIISALMANGTEVNLND